MFSTCASTSYSLQLDQRPRCSDTFPVRHASSDLNELFMKTLWRKDRTCSYTLKVCAVRACVCVMLAACVCVCVCKTILTQRTVQKPKHYYVIWLIFWDSDSSMATVVACSILSVIVCLCVRVCLFGAGLWLCWILLIKNCNMNYSIENHRRFNWLKYSNQ